MFSAVRPDLRTARIDITLSRYVKIVWSRPDAQIQMLGAASERRADSPRLCSLTPGRATPTPRLRSPHARILVIAESALCIFDILHPRRGSSMADSSLRHPGAREVPSSGTHGITVHTTLYTHTRGSARRRSHAGRRTRPVGHYPHPIPASRRAGVRSASSPLEVSSRLSHASNFSIAETPLF
jgi:hypothetical protein